MPMGPSDQYYNIPVTLGGVLGSIAEFCVYIGYIVPKRLRGRWIE